MQSLEVGLLSGQFEDSQQVVDHGCLFSSAHYGVSYCENGNDPGLAMEHIGGCLVGGSRGKVLKVAPVVGMSITAGHRF